MGSSAHFLFVASDSMQLVELIEQAVAGLGYELVDFESSPRGRLMRIFIDRSPGAGIAPAADEVSQGGITVDDCSAVSNHLTRLFTVENIDYDRLEVSSPGLDRVVKKAADFERFAGHEMQLKLRVPVNNQRNFSGVLGGMRDGEVVLTSEGVTYAFAFDNVERARLVPKF